jgi:Ca2+-binding EF-hand superfamily protein
VPQISLPKTTFTTSRPETTTMGLCASTSAVDIRKKQSSMQFHGMQRKFSTNTDAVAKDEFGTYVEQHGELWAMLGVNLNLEEAQCKAIAVDVAFNMVVKEVLRLQSQNGKTKTTTKTKAKKRRQTSIERRTSATDGHTIMTKDQFFEFQELVSHPLGQLEFFHRTVFQAFDKDNNGLLDNAELDSFLNTFYAADSIFKGDARLPPKEELKAIVHARFDHDNDGHLSYDEIHAIISGKADLSKLKTSEKQPDNEGTPTDSIDVVVGSDL